MSTHPTPPQAHEREPTKGNPPTVEIDFEYYERYLADYDISDAEKRELIMRMAAIMMAFVDLGFNIAPGQIACEESSENFPQIDDLLTDFITDQGADMLYSKPYSDNSINGNTAPDIAAEGSES